MRPTKKRTTTEATANPGAPEQAANSLRGRALQRTRKRTETNSRQSAYEDWLALSEQYDEKRGGYTLDKGRAGAKFFASKYTPDQGGYYADEGGDPDRARSIAQFRSSLRPYQRVNPSLRRSRTAVRREKNAVNTRSSGTLLGGQRLLGSDDKNPRRKTLLGG